MGQKSGQINMKTVYIINVEDDGTLQHPVTSLQGTQTVNPPPHRVKAYQLYKLD